MAELLNKNDFINSVLKAALENPLEKEKLLSSPKLYFESKLNFKLPENLEVNVLQDLPNRINIVLPAKSDELSEIELAAVSGGVCWSYDDGSPCSYDCPSDIRLKKNISDLN